LKQESHFKVHQIFNGRNNSKNIGLKFSGLKFNQKKEKKPVMFNKSMIRKILKLASVKLKNEGIDYWAVDLRFYWLVIDMETALIIHSHQTVNGNMATWQHGNMATATALDHQ